jgi:transposase-like protein
VRKLTESDKQEILKLYRESAETTSTLAERYDVSNSTISRLLKSTLPEDEYEYLVSLKRAARTPEGRAQVSYENMPVFSSQSKSTTEEIEEPKLRVAQQRIEPLPEEEPEEEPVVPEEEFTFDEEHRTLPVPRRVRRRSSAVEPPIPRRPVAEQLELLQPKPQEITSIPSPLLEVAEDRHQEANVIAEMFGEDLLEDLEEEEEYLEEEIEEDDDEYELPQPLVKRPRTSEELVRVLPLSAASLPKTCYLVIDRSSELITRPLKDFGDLGQIPSLETQQKTLPIFDNHRVAKRFSTKRDRVIKVPDSKMLHKARYHLQAKGITRLLIDGHVYSLAPGQS